MLCFRPCAVAKHSVTFVLRTRTHKFSNTLPVSFLFVVRSSIVSSLLQTEASRCLRDRELKLVLHLLFGCVRRKIEGVETGGGLREALHIPLDLLQAEQFGVACGATACLSVTARMDHCGLTDGLDYWKK